MPKTILQLMNVDGMTRENVASHLQKYRLYLKKLGGYPANAKTTPEALQQVQQVLLKPVPICILSASSSAYTDTHRLPHTHTHIKTAPYACTAAVDVS